MARGQGKPKTALTNDELARAALAYMDEYGIDALSFRKLSEATGVPTMTIMNRFGSKYDLMKAALAVMLDEVDLSAVPGETWQDALRRISHANRNMALRHPKSFMLFVLVPSYESPVLEFTARVFSTHAEQGLPREMPSVFLSLMHSFLPGFQLAEGYANGHKAQARDFTPQQAAVLDLFTEATFNRNLEILIAGLEARYGLPPEKAGR